MLAWYGNAFEDVCRAHIRQIKNALGIGDVTTRESSWIVPGTETERGMQIDLVIDRDDMIGLGIFIILIVIPYQKGFDNHIQ